MGIAIVLDQQLNRRAPPSEAVCFTKATVRVKKITVPDSTIVVETIPLETS